MKQRFTRRDLLQRMGIAGAASMLAHPAAGAQMLLKGAVDAGGDQRAETHDGPRKEHTIVLETKDMVVSFDQRYGSISSIIRKGDLLATNYMGNEDNTPGVDRSNSRWTGDLVTSVFEVTDKDPRHSKWNPRSEFILEGEWRPELTGRSADIRQVSMEKGVVSVRYTGASKNENGLKSFDLLLKYHAGTDGSLLWDIELSNTTGKVLEIGELGFPLMVNDDQGEYYVDPHTGQPFPADDTEHPLRIPADYFSVYRNEYPRIQKQYHENKVIAHPFIGGDSSYVLIERPLGDAPYLLLHSVHNGTFECAYRDNSSFVRNAYLSNGPNILAVRSWATYNLRNWEKNPWINGHTSMVMQPGDTWLCKLRFSFVDGYEAVPEAIASAGNLGVRVLPSMVVQQDTDAHVELRCEADIDRVEFFSDNITLKSKHRLQDRTLLTFSFLGRGQKSLRFHYGDRWTNIHFYCVEDIASLIKERARFIVDREYYNNPKDPYHRYHMFLPFDHRIGSTFRDADEVSEVGGMDAEFGVSEPLFLAEKNVYYPSPREIATMETYIDDCLFKYIQDPETYAVRASLYWKLRYPSSPWSHWTEDRTKDSYRAYNYAHVANIYHAMYQIGKRYGLLTRRTAKEYLLMAYHTSVQMFRSDPWGHIGVMGGSNSLHIMEDLGREGLDSERQQLLEEIRVCNQVFLNDPYPYTSEYPVDTTAQEQVYFFTRYFGNTEKNRKTLQVMRALRGGNQPIWFQYGNDNKGDLCCWYTESTNGWALLEGFEDTGDLDTLIKGFAGVMSVEADMLTDGMCYAHFISTPGILDFTPPRTLDGGIAQFGFLKAAKAYVVHDESFGLVGFGCRIEHAEQGITVYPHDGLRKRLYVAPHTVNLEATQGEIESVSMNDDASRFELCLSDSTDVLTETKIQLKGLDQGAYTVRHGETIRAVQVTTGAWELVVPIADARFIVLERNRTAPSPVPPLVT